MKVGDIILTRDGKSFLAKGIMFFMKVYKKKNKINCPLNYHHAGLVIDIWGILHIAESTAKGFIIQLPDKAYSEYDWKTRVDILTPLIPYTIKEQNELSKLAVQFSIGSNRYDFANFFFQVWFILFGKWIGPIKEKAESRFYCSEAIATITNYIRPNTFKNPASTNPVDVAVNSNFIKLIYNE